MVFKSFTNLLLLRVSLLTLTLLLFSTVVVNTDFYVVTFLLISCAGGQVFELIRWMSKTNHELSRFIEAIKYQDFSQRFHPQDHLPEKNSANFESLSVIFQQVMQHIQVDRQQQEERLRYLDALIAHIPVAIISIDQHQLLKIHNNAARHLLGDSLLSKVSDLECFGESFVDQLSQLQPGETQLVTFQSQGMERQLTVVASQIVIGSMSETVISLQDIQSELDRVQLKSWQDLVRVLTHEIMNSITPISSLSKTVSSLAGDAHSQMLSGENINRIAEDLTDVSQAADTVAKRSEGLMQFVQSYRSLTAMPEPKLQSIRVRELFQRIETLLTDEWQKSAITLIVDLPTERLEIQADVDLIEQVLLNLLQNAQQALLEEKGENNIEKPQVMLSGKVHHRGYVMIEVADNGLGISDDIINEIFVPFFTTKKQGSGVGLALSRQIMLAHGGNISVGKASQGGAKFVLIF